MAVLFVLSENSIIVKMFRSIVGTDPYVRPYIITKRFLVSF